MNWEGNPGACVVTEARRRKREGGTELDALRD